MTARLKGAVVTFQEDLREDDAAALLNAIRMLRGVVDVASCEATGEDHMVRARVRLELEQKLYDVLK